MSRFNLIRTSIFFHIYIKSCFGVPLGNTSSSGEIKTPISSTALVGYVGDPNGRGTSSLVISCLLTLVLCVWSALHLNVPRQSDTRLHCLMVNVRWIITGVYAPELVVFTAWRQWSSAKILGNLVRGLERENSNNQASSMNGGCQNNDTNPGLEISNNLTNFPVRRHPWTMTHDFFASTGGFVFEIENIESQDKGEKAIPFLPPNCPHRLTVTARGMALLAKCGRLPDIPKEDILDKSKANDLAKALVMIQASWMLLQVIGRLIARLPVTLLEVNTIAHVLCALLMYIMWWHKPLSPNEPFVLKGDWVNGLCAYMYMSSEISGEIYEKSVESQTMVKTMFASLHLYSKTSEMEKMCFSRRKPPKKPNASESSIEVTETLNPQSLPDNQNSDSDAPAFRLTSKESIDELRFKMVRKATATAFFERRPRVKGAQSPVTTDTAITEHRWRLAASAVNTYPALQKDYVTQVQHPDCIHFKPEELVVFRVQNWPWDDLLRNVGGLIVGFVLWLANFAYGAIHAAAWNEHFPTAVEKWLWRSSSVYIGFCGGLWIVLNYVAQAYRPLNEFWERWMDGGGKKWQNVLIGVPVFVCGFSLLFARGFIVVEAFVSIRQLPAAAYDTPTWSQVFPHF